MGLWGGGLFRGGNQHRRDLIVINKNGFFRPTRVDSDYAARFGWKAGLVFLGGFRPEKVTLMIIAIVTAFELIRNQHLDCAAVPGHASH